MGKRPTIYDVAARAGVSKSLVSLVLQESPSVSTGRREAVHAAVEALGYTPSRLAAGLAGSRTRSIGVVIDEFERLWFAPALAGLRDVLAAERYTLSISDAALNSHLDLDPLEAFRALRVDGVVLAGEASPESLARLGVPVVVLGTRGVEATGITVVAGDEVAGGRLAVAHLVELGHTDIACVSAPGALAAAREAGYVAGMRDRGLPVRIVRAAESSEAAADAAVAELLDGAASDPRPTAVFAVSDPMALGVMGAAAARNLAVPGELSVLGYGDSPLAAYGLVSLTSVSGDARRLGQAAGRELLALLDGAHAPTKTLLPPRLRPRRSTARC
ncbi:LacI family transcriptional regulator [Leucobacter luti]|uniref:LacI family transcriptional regulator n=1 Tax=Leucobacter luti TaxID=340320 RepID=A0A4R6S3M7_9MICO|nr:LacI family DNA-binding transcriptional regulator [Leucobacter luti]TDP93295.1 LacI family transcriptional regulator [Leucobacter luti]